MAAASVPTLDVMTTIPAVYMELWGLVVVFAAFGKRLDAGRWILAFAALLSTLLAAVQDMTGWANVGRTGH